MCKNETLSRWGGLTDLTVLRSRCPAGAIDTARVTFLTYKKEAKDDLPVPEHHVDFKYLRVIEKCTHVHR